MIDPTRIDINKLPKVFVDGALGSHGRNFFTFALTSGEELHTFATTPQVMKSIAAWMAKTVKDYEKQHGKIDMTPPKIVSPIQVSDLGDGGAGKKL